MRRKVDAGLAAVRFCFRRASPSSRRAYNSGVGSDAQLECVPMHPDAAIALSFLTDLPRLALTERLCADDPELLERAASVRSIAQDARGKAASAGIDAIAWNDPRFPA